MVKLPDAQPYVAVNFRMRERSYALLMKEVGSCGCNLSAFIRHAVMTEIAKRQRDRNANKKVGELLGQNELIGIDSAQNNA